MGWNDGTLLKVLYLEDDRDDACLLKDQLHCIREPRFFITHLRYAGQAIEFLEFENYDFVVCDYFLQCRGNYDRTCEPFVRELIKHRPDTTVIVTSNQDFRADHASPWFCQLLEAGLVGFIRKNLWSPEALLDVFMRTDRHRLLATAAEDCPQRA